MSKTVKREVMQDEAGDDTHGRSSTQSIQHDSENLGENYDVNSDEVYNNQDLIMSMDSEEQRIREEGLNNSVEETVISDSLHDWSSENQTKVGILWKLVK